MNKNKRNIIEFNCPKNKSTSNFVEYSKLDVTF